MGDHEGGPRWETKKGAHERGDHVGPPIPDPGIRTVALDKLFKEKLGPCYTTLGPFYWA